MSNEHKSQKEGYKPTVKGDPVLPLRRRMVVGSPGPPNPGSLQELSPLGIPHHKPPVKEGGPRKCFQGNFTEHLRNQCPELKEIKPHPTIIMQLFLTQKPQRHLQFI